LSGRLSVRTRIPGPISNPDILVSSAIGPSGTTGMRIEDLIPETQTEECANRSDRIPLSARRTTNGCRITDARMTKLTLSVRRTMSPGNNVADVADAEGLGIRRLAGIDHEPPRLPRRVERAEVEPIRADDIIPGSRNEVMLCREFRQRLLERQQCSRRRRVAPLAAAGPHLPPLIAEPAVRFVHAPTAPCRCSPHPMSSSRATSHHGRCTRQSAGRGSAAGRECRHPCRCDTVSGEGLNAIKAIDPTTATPDLSLVSFELKCKTCPPTWNAGSAEPG
jgi:hypothetical protein